MTEYDCTKEEKRLFKCLCADLKEGVFEAKDAVSYLSRRGMPQGEIPKTGMASSFHKLCEGGFRAVVSFFGIDFIVDINDHRDLIRVKSIRSAS